MSIDPPLIDSDRKVDEEWQVKSWNTKLPAASLLTAIQLATAGTIIEKFTINYTATDPTKSSLYKQSKDIDEMKGNQPKCEKLEDQHTQQERLKAIIGSHSLFPDGWELTSRVITVHYKDNSMDSVHRYVVNG